MKVFSLCGGLQFHRQRVRNTETDAGGIPCKSQSDSNIEKGEKGERRELKHLSTSRKRKKVDSLSSGDRKGKSPNRRRYGVVGVVGPCTKYHTGTGTVWKVGAQRVILPYRQRV